MDNKITFACALLLLGISLVTFLSREPYAFAQNYNQPIEISDCPVQGNSTYEISGPCPDSEENGGASNTEYTQDSIGKPPEPLKETDTLLPDISGLADPFRSLK